MRTLRELIVGDFLLHAGFRKHVPFIAFLALLALISIYSSHSVDKKVLRIAKMRNEVKELNSEYIETRSRLMIESTHTKVVQKAKELGLEESKTPPKVLKINKKGKVIND